jgi:transposase
MLSLPASVRVFVATTPVDFRKSHDGLFGVVVSTLRADPFSGHLFVFFNKRRDRIKVLVYDGSGLWLFYKRLDRGVFESASHLGGSGESTELDTARFQMLLQGIDLRKSKIRHRFGARSRRKSAARANP